MTAVLPIPPRDDGTSSGLLPYDHFHWIFARGLGLRALVSLFIWWNILVFPGQSRPHAWVPGIVLLLVDGLAWVVRRQKPSAIVLWAMVTTAFDLVLGIAALTAFSTSLESNAPALLPLIGIELIAYWGWIGYGIALGYSTIVIVTFWPFPSDALTAYAASHIIFWLVVNVLTISSVALLLHRTPAAEQAASPLTAREREVYQLLRAGLTQKDIASQLHIERSTVKTHVQHIHRKMGLDEPVDEDH